MSRSQRLAFWRMMSSWRRHGWHLEDLVPQTSEKPRSLNILVESWHVDSWFIGNSYLDIFRTFNKENIITVYYSIGISQETTEKDHSHSSTWNSGWRLEKRMRWMAPPWSCACSGLKMWVGHKARVGAGRTSTHGMPRSYGCCGGSTRMYKTNQKRMEPFRYDFAGLWNRIQASTKLRYRYCSVCVTYRPVTTCNYALTTINTFFVPIWVDASCFGAGSWWPIWVTLVLWSVDSRPELTRDLWVTLVQLYYLG